MKFILELVLATIIIFFVWNILKRIFFNAFYKKFPIFNPKNHQQTKQQQSSTKKAKPKVNWEAETIDYEEVKEDKK